VIEERDTLDKASGRGSVTSTYGPQVAFLDHVYAVVDVGTAEAIAKSDFLHGFGRFVVGTTRADGETWTGRYLFGRRTYVELFGPGDLEGSGEAIGSTGIGLSTEDRGGLAIVSDRMRVEDSLVEVSRRIRQEDDREVAWFDYLSPPDADRTLSVWVMEFLEIPDDLQVRAGKYMEWIDQTDKPDSNGSASQLTEVSSVALDATVDDVAVAEPLLKAAGFVVTRAGDVLSAVDLRTTISMRCTAADAVGLRRLEFELAAPAVAPHVEAIGGSTLTVGPGQRATWDFPHKA
jgi:hypothetical protein